MNYFNGKTLQRVLLTGICSLLLASPALAVENELDGFVFDDPAPVINSVCRPTVDLNLREEPNTDSNIITTLGEGWNLAILDDSVKDWFKITYDGKVGYVSGKYIHVDSDNIFTSNGRVNTDYVNVHTEGLEESDIVITLNTDDLVAVDSLTEDGWYGVVCENGETGYIRSDLLDLVSPEVSAFGKDNPIGVDVIATAKQYLGVRYVYGGASPSAFDCSGFTMYVYSKYGYSLPHTASGQWQSGLGSQTRSISGLQTGDLVFFNDPKRNAGKACSHTGIYIGEGQFIHASSSRGVIISDLTSGYYNNYFVGGLHLL